MKILITSGGTKVAIDAVRSITNLSHGTFGSKLAREMLVHLDGSVGNPALRGEPDQVTFLRAKGSKSPFSATVNWHAGADAHVQFKALQDLLVVYNRLDTGYEEIEFDTFDDYRQTMEALMSRSWDIVILVAAVSDFGVKNYVDGKIRSKDAMTIELEPTEKIIAGIKKVQPNCMLVGFKLLVDSTDEELVAAAQKSAVDNDCEIVVANDLRDIQRGQHRIMLVGKEGLIGSGGLQKEAHDPELLEKLLTHHILHRFYHFQHLKGLVPT